MRKEKESALLGAAAGVKKRFPKVGESPSSGQSLMRWLWGVVVMTALSCHSTRPPEFVSMEGLKISNTGFSGADLSADLHFFNPNKWGARLQKMEVDIYINQSFLGHCGQILSLHIPGKAAFTLPLTIRVDMKNLLKTGLATQLKKTSTIRITGTVDVQKGGITKKVRVDYATERDFSLLH